MVEVSALRRLEGHGPTLCGAGGTTKGTISPRNLESTRINIGLSIVMGVPQMDGLFSL